MRRLLRLLCHQCRVALYVNCLQICRPPLPFHRRPLPQRRPLQSNLPPLFLASHPRLVLRVLCSVNLLSLVRPSLDSASSPFPRSAKHLPSGSPRQYRPLDRHLLHHSLANHPHLLLVLLHLVLGSVLSPPPGRLNSVSHHSVLVVHRKSHRRHLHLHPSPKKAWLQTTPHP